MVSAVSSAKSD